MTAAAAAAASTTTTEGAQHSVIQIFQQGGRDQLRFERVPRPVPKANEVLIRNHFAGVNFIDTYHRAGVYPVELPFVLGVEGAGVVEALGEGLAGTPGAPKLGDRVAYYSRGGSYAGYTCADASRLVHVPDTLSLELATAAMVQGMTAWTLVSLAYEVKKGDYVLVHAAAGGTGQALCQLASHLGAHVIGTTSTEEKAQVARAAGARDVILYGQQDVTAEVLRITGGRGAHVVYDGVGKDTFNSSLKSCGLGATLVAFGNASGKVPPFDILGLTFNNIRLMRPTLSEYVKAAADLKKVAAAVLELVANGVLKLSIHGVLPLKDAAQAHQLLEERKTTGKLLLDTSE